MDLISIEVLYNNVSILFLSALYFCQEARISQRQRLSANHIALRSSRKCPPTSVKEFPSFLSQRRQKKWMNGKKDRNLTTKEGKTMSHLGQKPPIPYHHKKTPCYTDVSLCVPKTKRQPRQNRKGYLSH